jgi:hypothetical protein
MKIILVVCVFLFSFVDIWAQLTLIGKVVNDKNMPISEVSVYLENKPEIGSPTNREGVFVLPLSETNPLDIRLIFSCIGYKTKKIMYPTLTDTILIHLENEYYALPEVEISYLRANDMLQLGIKNLKERLLKDKSLEYQLHYFEQEITSGESRMVEAKYVTTLKKTPKGKGKIAYLFNLISKHKRLRLQEPINSVVFAKKFFMQIFHFNYLNYYEIDDDFSIKYISNDADSVFYLVCNPISETQSNVSFTIRKSDSVLTSIRLESIDSILVNNPHRKRLFSRSKPLHREFTVVFEKDDNNWNYYMNRLELNFVFEFIFGKKMEILTNYSLSQFQGYYSGDLNDKAKLKGVSGELFELEDTLP